jgi:hypothetical protein
VFAGSIFASLTAGDRPRCSERIAATQSRFLPPLRRLWFGTLSSSHGDRRFGPRRVNWLPLRLTAKRKSRPRDDFCRQHSNNRLRGTADITGGAGASTRSLQTFRHLHACSGCFRQERFPGGACTRWKAPPFHGAHPLATPVLPNTKPGTVVLRVSPSCEDRRLWSGLGQSAKACELSAGFVASQPSEGLPLSLQPALPASATSSLLGALAFRTAQAVASRLACRARAMTTWELPTILTGFNGSS